jgi:hypothetical protein
VLAPWRFAAHLRALVAVGTEFRPVCVLLARGAFEGCVCIMAGLLVGNRVAVDD